MSYKFILTAVSSVGDTHQKSDEFYFADGLSSVSKDVCNSSRIRIICKGKKHIFSVISCRDRFGMFCDYLSHALLKRNADKYRIKAQFDLKNITDEIYKMTDKENDANMSMLCIDGSNIYASGFGNTHIYHLTSKMGAVKKIAFSLPSLSGVIPKDDDSSLDAVCTWTKCIGELKVKDEYLLVGSHLQNLLGDDVICDALSSLHIDSPINLTDKAHLTDSSCTVTALHILVKKTFPVLWACVGALLVALALLLLFLL